MISLTIEVKPSADLVIIIQEFLSILVRTKKLFDKMKQAALSEGIGGEALRILLQHHAKRMGVHRNSVGYWLKAIDDSTSQSAQFVQNDYNNVLGNDVRLINGDFIEESDKHISDNSIDLIFTDPPYERGSLEYYRDLGYLAKRVLKLGGSLVTYVGQYALPEILHQLQESGLKYWWIFCIKHGGQHASMYQKRVFVEWKPLLWFVNGEALATDVDGEHETDFIADFIQSEPPHKEFHEWAQSTVEAEYVISKLTTSSDAEVFDPFLGSGTTGLAALKLTRKFIGIEKNTEKFAIAKSRIEQMAQID